MSKRVACLLDIGFGTLHGSANSAARMAACLRARGFTTQLLSDAEVTRERVAALLRAQLPGLAAGDAFVLYFVGHGDKVRGVAGRARADEPPPNAELLLLITHDLREPGCELPGIAGPELIDWLAPLARRTGNVTLILDCCRAATLVPGSAPVDPAVVAWIDATLREATPALRHRFEVHRSSEPEVVRIVATTRNEPAVERRGPGGPVGLFTDALVQVLERHPDDDCSWDQLLPELQALVLADSPSQRPGVEGPRDRLPFSRRERRAPEQYPCRAGSAGWIVDAGALHGVEVGDRFLLGDVPATVRRVEPDSAELGGRVLTAPTWARRTACARQDVVSWPEALPLPTSDAPWLRLHHGEHTGAIGRVEQSGDTLMLRDVRGTVVHLGAADIVAAAARLARWHRQAPAFAALTGAAPAQITWGLAGADDPLPPDGAELPANSRVWIHAWADTEVYVSLLRLRADLRLVHHGDLDHGVPVARSTVDLTRRPGGLPLGWSPGVPPDGPRDEALYLLISRRPRAFHRLGTTASERRSDPPEVTRSATEPAPTLTLVRLAYRLLPSV